MSDSTHPTFESLSDALTIPQRTALTSLIAGSNITDAAQSAGVHRTTLHRWITSDPAFAAAYNSWEHECKASSKAKLLSAVQDALAVVIAAVKQGNHSIAYRLLKYLGLLSKIDPGLTDPEQVRQLFEQNEATLKCLPNPTDPNRAT